MLSTLLKKANEKMEKSQHILEVEFRKIRTARANPALVENIQITYYGNSLPLKQIASIGIPEPRMIVIQPWDKNAVSEIEKALLKSDLGITPKNEGGIIRLLLPPLSKERREELKKMVSRLAEQTKVSIRNIRREFMDDLKKLLKEGEKGEDEVKQEERELQKLTDQHIKNIDKLLERKVKEIMEV